MISEPTERENKVKDSAELLYHYTSQAGLLGILDSGSIWATHIRYLNDSSEFDRGIEIAKRHVRCIKIDQTQFEVLGQNAAVCNLLDNVLRDSLGQALTLFDNVDVYVASFFDSVEFATGRVIQNAGDILEQWRAYARGAAGFSIAFDKSMLAEHLAEIGESLTAPICSGNCNYSETVQEGYLSRQVAEIAPLILGQFEVVMNQFKTEAFPSIMEAVQARLGSESLDKVLKETLETVASELRRRFEVRKNSITSSMISILIKLAIPPIFMKHPAFQAENEWRLAQLVVNSSTETRFRVDQFSLIPYVPVPLPLKRDGFLRKIIVGMTPKMDQALRSARLLLESKGFKVRQGSEGDGVEISGSKIPFRPW